MSVPLIILEGGDCAGKTTLANTLRKRLPNASYVHYSDMAPVKRSLPRMYTEGMLPAVIGHRPVIMDRCWLSEEPYCRVFRPDETPRLDDADTRMLERLALTCRPLVIYCDPGWKTVEPLFKERKAAKPAAEYLDSADQLKHVREWYHKTMRRSHLPIVRYDWTSKAAPDFVDALVQRISDFYEDLLRLENIKGVGGTYATTLVVGDEFAKHQEFDPHYQWPFASFSNVGCSRWLATQMDKYHIPEGKLWWVNQDQLDHDSAVADILDAIPTISSIACLGAKARDRVNELLANPEYIYHFNHPQHHKRFHSDEPYPLLDFLKEATT